MVDMKNTLGRQFTFLLSQARRELFNELPPVFDANKASLRIQLLHRAGRLDESLQAIREELTSGRKTDVSPRV